MITYEIAKDHIIVEGHAGYDHSGRDIVCSAVSALTQSLIYGLIKYARISHIESPGKVIVQWANLDWTGSVLVDVYKMAMHDIREQYPEYVQERTA